MPAPLPTPRFDTFYRHAELAQLLQAYADARPDLVDLRVLGKSHEGRDIALVVLTNSATGDDTDKPAIWVDGNIHAGELTASTACLYWLHQLVSGHGTDADAGPQITQLLDTRVVYLCPRLNPDGAELALADKPRFISTTDRAHNQEALKQLLEAVFTRQPVAHWIAAFNDAGVPHARINDYAAALADAQTEHMGWVQPLTLPNGQQTHTFASPVRLNGQGFPIRRPPPALGEHTAEIRAAHAAPQDTP